jgi:hypothetical protein
MNASAAIGDLLLLQREAAFLTRPKKRAYGV